MSLPRRTTSELAKRAFDVAGALVLVILTAPIMAAAGVLVRLSSPGPVLFRQERVGRNGRSFQMLKLRTMRVSSGGPELTMASDPAGAEVPNVLTGVDKFARVRPDRVAARTICPAATPR